MNVNETELTDWLSPVHHFANASHVSGQLDEKQRLPKNASPWARRKAFDIYRRSNASNEH